MLSALGNLDDLLARPSYQNGPHLNRPPLSADLRPIIAQKSLEHLVLDERVNNVSY